MRDLLDSTPVCYSAAGNRFALQDGFASEVLPPDGIARLAVEWCRRLQLDGVLVALPAPGAAARMQVYNRDGSRAEACGNGLRCVARFLHERGAGQDDFWIETDSGRRHVSCRVRDGVVRAVRTELGVPRIVALRTTVESEEGERNAAQVDMGNPHCVVWVENVERAPVEALGTRMQRDARFPEGVNVSFVEVSAPLEREGEARSETAGRAVRQAPGGWGAAVGGTPDLLVRTFERGVGETAACGTGVSAAAAAALRLGRVQSPVRALVRGGELRVDWDGVGPLHLEGPVERLTPEQVG